MCMQDLWIARHTQVVRLGTAGSLTVEANVNRLALIVAGGCAYTIVASKSRTWFQQQFIRIPTNFSTADTNEVPPTDNTGTISATAFSDNYNTQVLWVSQYGAIVTEPCTVTMSVGSAVVLEVVADAVLQERLNQLETLEGWPLYGLPAKLKVANG